MTRNGSNRARFGPFEVDLHTHELWKYGTRLKLVGQPFEILAMLLSKPGELVTREELRTRLWPADTFVDFNHGLNAAVNKLREALSDSADTPRFVETLPRRGYRFIATIDWMNAASRPAIAISPVRAEPPLLPQPVPQLAPEHAPEPEGDARPARAWAPLFTGTAVLVMLLAGMFLLQHVSGHIAQPASNVSPQRTRPLPFVGADELAFSPDGNAVAFVRVEGRPEERGIFVAPVGSDQRVQLTRNQGDRCPVWSPDGRSIAFSRYDNKEFAIYIVPAGGGAEQKRNGEKSLTPATAAYAATAGTMERKLDTHGIIPQRGEVDWSLDGQFIAFAGPDGIYLLSPVDSSVRRITETPPLAQDWGPTFSPDSRRVLFVRDHQGDLSNEIRSVSVGGGDWTHIYSERGRITSPPQWSYDGRSVIFSSNRTGHPALWRISLDAPGEPTQIAEAGSPAWDPAISRRGYRMAYERLFRSLSIWELDLSASGEASPSDKLPSLLIGSTSDTDQGPAPQFSPDGKKLAYMSDHSGTMEIWVSNRDGSDPFQLTAVGVAGTPRWAPDSQSIVFDADSPGSRRVLTINLHGGAPQVITPDKFESEVPSWSRDGKWIYFASNRSGDLQVWKAPVAGGPPVQVTHQGGHAALESLDGKTLYYAKTPMPEPEIWQVAVAGGPETAVPLVRPGTWASWQVVEGGILFVGPSLGHQAVLSFYDFARQRTTTVAVLERVPFWLGATHDGRTVAFDQPGQEQAQTMLVENFR